MASVDILSFKAGLIDASIEPSLFARTLIDLHRIIEGLKTEKVSLDITNFAFIIKEQSFGYYSLQTVTRNYTL